MQKNSNDIIDIIVHDHLEIKALYKMLQDPKVQMHKKRTAFSTLSVLLHNHNQAEEQSLYQALKDASILKVETLKGIKEHKMIAQLTDEIRTISNDDDLWAAKIGIIAEFIERHLKQEENELFKNAKKEFDIEKRKQIGSKYIAFYKNEINHRTNGVSADYSLGY
jgi:hemerythrin-like domain-containing protein